MGTGVFHTELSEKTHHFARNTGGEIDVINFIKRRGTVLYNSTDILFGRFNVIYSGNSLNGLTTVSDLKVKGDSTSSQIRITEQRCNLLFCELIETNSLETIPFTYINTFQRPIIPKSASLLIINNRQDSYVGSISSFWLEMSKMDLMRSSQLHSKWRSYSFVFPEVTFDTILFKSHK